MSRATLTARPLPPVASRDEWEAAREELLAAEREVLARVREMAARRKALPMTRIEEDYSFEGPAGPVKLSDLFEGRSQLIVYHFMFHPDWQDGCEGCSMYVDGVPHLAHLHARDASFALVSRAPIETLLAYRRRMGWDFPWYSSAGSSFNRHFEATVGDSEHPGLSVFMRDGDDVYLTYRGHDWVVQADGVASFIDLLPYGSQEHGEVVPEGWPQGDKYTWMRRHDEYHTGLPAPSTLLDG